MLGFRTSDLVVIGSLAALAYYLYQKAPNLTGPGSALDSAENAIANLFPGTSPQVQFNPALQIQFPDGSTIPISTISGTQTSSGGQVTFPYNGSTWQLAPQVNGVYQATQLSGLGSYDAWNDDPLIDKLFARGRK